MTRQTNNDKFDTEKTFKQGLGGGILGAFVGMPGLGMGLGMLNANKENLKTWTHSVSQRAKEEDKRLFNKKSNARDKPENFFF